MAELPSGTVSVLFTDIEGSTRLLSKLRDGYAAVLAEHGQILRQAFEEHAGDVVDTQGDSFFVVFRRARDAVAAAVAAQRGLAAHSRPEQSEVRVRVGLHTGEPVLENGRYVGLGVHRAARIMSAGHGGQVLLSNATRELVEDELPADVALRDLGRQRLKDIDRPESLFQLVIEGLPNEFPPLRSVEAEPEVPTAATRGLPRRRALLLSGFAGALAAAIAIPIFALGRGNPGHDRLGVAGCPLCPQLWGHCGQLSSL